MSENYDIMGRYFLYQLDNNLGSNSFGDAYSITEELVKHIDHSIETLCTQRCNLTYN